MLRLYYAEEPWGPWRDNMHAAIIARELVVLGNRLTRNHKQSALRDFILMDPAERSAGNVSALVGFLKASAGGNRVHKSAATKRPPSGRLKAKLKRSGKRG